MRIAAIDPGDRHCGLAVFDLWWPDDGKVHPAACTGHLDCSSSRWLHLVGLYDLRQQELFDYIEANAWYLGAIVYETFKLYPWMARQQGFSEFHTAEAIGVIKYLARKYDIPHYGQDAKDSKRHGRAYAVKAGFKMKDRKLGSGKFMYYGPDFDQGLESEQHFRDAAAHAVFWSNRNRESPIYHWSMKTELAQL